MLQRPVGQGSCSWHLQPGVSIEGQKHYCRRAAVKEKMVLRCKKEFPVMFVRVMVMRAF